MSANHSKIHLRFGATDITIEGDEHFVSKRFQEIFGGEQPVKESDSNIEKEASPVEKSSPQMSSSLDKIVYERFLNRLGTDFKDWLARLSKYASNRDKVLAAAYYSQLMQSNREFYVQDVSTVLEKHRIDIRNISNFIDTYEAQRLIYKSSDFPENPSYKFTDEGIRYISNLYASKIRTVVEE